MKTQKWFFLLFPLIVIAMILSITSCKNYSGKASFAIVIDSATYANTKNAVDAYRSMLESEGLHTYLLNSGWNTPDDIRNMLYELYQKKPILEGAVFIGEVPIPMIRDAQYLTSAFKMDQERFPFHRSSVPSDRFYDDFNLKFEFLKRDEERPLYYYYSLAAASSQKVSTNIYSGRIKPPSAGKDFYEQINHYLNKVVEERKNKNPLNHAVTYAGNGYNSECLVAWGSERIAYREQLPQLFEGDGSYKFLFTHMSDFSKSQLLSEIQRPELDMVIMSNHGSPTEQYLDGWPNVSDINGSIVNVRRFLRSKLRDAQRRNNDLEATRRSYMDRHGVPREWFDDTFDTIMIKEDSLFNANLDIHIPDVDGIESNARFMKFDACFNGSFHLDDYIAGHYVFGSGKTIVALANSVNVLQDNWPVEMVGLLAEGVRIGNWARHIHYLENHIIGDPTFYFDSPSGRSWNDLIVRKKNHPATWRKLLDHDNPDIQSLALVMLFNNKVSDFSDLLVKTYRNSPYGSVRMQCLSLLYQYNDKNFYEALKLAVSDPYELVRRLAVRMIGETGSNELLPALISVQFNDAHSKRVLFNARNSAAFMQKDEMLKIIEEQYSNSHLVHKDELKSRIFGMADSRILSDLSVVRDPEQDDRLRIREIKTLRNYTYHFHVPDYIEIASNPREKLEIRLAMIEALGWFTHSYNHHLIEEMCERIIDSQLEEEVIKKEALKTLNRIRAYSKET